MYKIGMHGIYHPFKSNHRFELITDHSRINEIRLFIRENFTKRKNLNYNLTSYGLKHFIERKTGWYVANGEAIEAMRLEGFTIKPIKLSPICYFNIGSFKKPKLYSHEF